MITFLLCVLPHGYCKWGHIGNILASDGATFGLWQCARCHALSQGRVARSDDRGPTAMPLSRGERIMRALVFAGMAAGAWFLVRQAVAP